MKKTLLFLTALLCVTSLYTQPDAVPPLTNEEFFTKAELVFEGQFLRYVHTYNLKGTYKYNDTYAIIAYKVKKVYKGAPSLVGEVVYKVIQGATLGTEKDSWKSSSISYWDPYVFYKNGIDEGVSKYSPRIFFFVASDLPDDPNSKYASCKKYKLLSDCFRGRAFDDRYASDEMHVSLEDKILGLNNLVFHKREDFYNYMRQFKGFAVPEPESLPEKQPEPETKPYNKAELDSLYNEVIRTKWGDHKKKTLTNPKKINTDTTLTLQLANQQIIYDNTQHKYYVKLDLMASTNTPNLFFDAINVRIGYNPAIFGPNISENNKITVSAAPKFENYWLLSPYDQYPDGFQILFLSDSYYGREQLGTVSKALIHFQIELLPDIDNLQSYFSFLDTAYTSTFSTYTFNKYDNYSTFFYYDKTYYINSDTLNITTQPYITHLNPSSRVAGIDDVLTIEGHNFGNTQGTVCFTAADDGGQTYLKGLDNQYIADWTNTQIKVKVPSMVSKGYETDSTNHSGGAGSGIIKIKTAMGDSCESTGRLHIPYSVLNHKLSGSDSIRRVFLGRTDCNYDFQFTLHEELRDSTNMIRVIDTALRHWSALTGLTLTLEKDISGNPIFVNTVNDSKNIIKFETNALMEAITSIAYIRRPDTVLYRYKGSHININPQTYSGAYDWCYDISGYVPEYHYSFYQAFMHELGHILLLGHVNDSTQLMYWKIKHLTNIINLDITDTAVLAVKQIIMDSKPAIWPNSSYVYPPVVLNASFTVTNVTCYGESIGSILTQTSGGAEPYFYHWTGNGIEIYDSCLYNLPAGTYYLWLGDATGCTKQYTVVVSQPEELTVNIVLPPNPIGRESYQANVTGGTPPYTYIWQYVSVTGKAPCNLADYLNSPIIPTSCETAICKLKLVVTDSLGCQIEAITPRGEKMPLNSTNINNEVRIIPNPTSGNFTITNIQDATIYLYSAQSAYMKTFEHITNNEAINISHLSSGIYFLKIIDGNTIKNEKLILYR